MDSLMPLPIMTRTLAITQTETSRLQTLFLALCLALGPAVAIGFGRFGYSLILPAMRADLGWNYGQAGALNTANAAGYFLGALLTGPLLQRVSNRPLLLFGLGLSVFALFLAGATRLFPLLLACRALLGFSAAFTFISATGLAARLGRDEAENALALAVSISGPGLGIILTGALVPFVLEGGTAHWPRAWGFMGAIGVLIFGVVAFATRGLGIRRSAGEVIEREIADLRPLWPVIAAYFFFGLGYIAYMTFLVAYVRALDGSAATVALIWITLGVSMLLATLLWKARLARDTGGQTLALMGFGSAICAILPLFSSALPVLLLSASGFGLMSMPVFTAVTVIMRRQLPRAALNSGIAGATTIFAAGQSLGPLGSGALSDHFGLQASLIWSGVILTLAAIVALRQKPAPDAPA